MKTTTTTTKTNLYRNVRFTYRKNESKIYKKLYITNNNNNKNPFTISKNVHKNI